MTRGADPIRILGLATANPEKSFSQEEAIEALREWYSRVGEENFDLSLERCERVFRNAGVGRRYSVLPVRDLLNPRPLGKKNRLYIDACRRLGSEVVKRAMENAGCSFEEIDLIITTSCTGFMIPSLDAFLLAEYPFRRDVGRLPVTELGCAAGVAALRIARDYLRGNPTSTVLIVAAETPTMNFQPTDGTGDHLVSCAIFGDGAAALVLGCRGEGGFALEEVGTRFFDGTESFMGFDLEETGFHIFLSPRIPRFIRTDLIPAVREILDGFQLPEPVRSWLVHPGGPKILEAIEESLGLSPEDLSLSRGVLRDFGNMSSATIFFILERFLKAEQDGRFHGIIAVGPGFQADMAVLRKD
ncbi:MAG: type III polyketide synthase [Candidatus Hydrogenedentota bacterium]|nr:MAG: type III polyketide synthase [Candidatus Hydrogenedentota bacterium]